MKNTKNTLRNVIIALLIISIALFSCTKKDKKTANEEFPTSSIEMIVPYSAGGGTDNAARIIAKALTEKLGQQVVVTNKAGAKGEIGFTAIAKSAPDGYTIGVLGSPDNFFLPKIKKTEYTKDSFDYLAIYNLSLPVLVAKAGGFTSLEELIEYGKKNPKKITLGASGGGPTIEVALTMSYGGYEATIVNFPGSADVMAAVIGGHIDAGLLTPSYLPTTDEAGAVPLVYFSNVKSKAYPDIVTMQELGFDINMAHNPIFSLPKGVPEERKKIIVDALEEISKDPNIAKQFEDLNTVFNYMAGTELYTYIDKLDATIEKIVNEYSELFTK